MAEILERDVTLPLKLSFHPCSFYTRFHETPD